MKGTVIFSYPHGEEGIEQSAQPTAVPAEEIKSVYEDESRLTEDGTLDIVPNMKKATILIVGGAFFFLFLAFGVMSWDKQSNAELPMVAESGNVTPVIEKSSGWIFSREGGRITSPWGASIIVPPEALPVDMQLEILRVSEGDVTDIFELRPSGAQFLKPVIVEIPYKTESLNNVYVSFWLKEGSKKLKLPFTADSEKKLLRAEVIEF